MTEGCVDDKYRFNAIRRTIQHPVALQDGYITSTPTPELSPLHHSDFHTAHTFTPTQLDIIATMLAFVPMSYNQRPHVQFERPEPDMSAYYLNLAAQHQRQAELAMARAQQARVQALRQRQFLEQAAYLDALHAYNPIHIQDRSPYSTQGDLLTAILSNQQHAIEITELQHKREQLKEERAEAMDRWLESAVVGFPAQRPTRVVVGAPLQRKKAVHFSPAVTSQPSKQVKPAVPAPNQEYHQKSAPAVPPVSRNPAPKAAPADNNTRVNHLQVEEFADQLWNALSSGRSDDEKTRILKAFGLPAPKPSAPPKPAAPRAEKVTSDTQPIASQTTATPPKSPSDAAEEAPAVPTEQERNSLLSAISTLEKKFDSLRTSFEFPAQVDFNASDSESDTHSVTSAVSDTPSLSYTSANKSLHAYENSLTGLLTKLDEVESRGFEEVRSTRKRLVRAIEAELESLDNKKVEAWLKQQEKEKVGSLGEKVAIQWETENVEASHESEPMHSQPTEVVTATERSTTSDAGPISSATTLRASSILPSEPAVLTPPVLVVTPAEVESPMTIEDADLPPVDIPVVPAHESDEPIPQPSGNTSRLNHDHVGTVIVPETLAPSVEQPDLQSVPASPSTATELPDNPTITKRRSVTIEEVVDEDFELV